jgi:hypothetical protein
VRRPSAILAAVAIVVAGCEGSDEPTRRDGRLQVFPASFEVVAGEPGRFLVGVTTPGNLFVSGGTVDLAFSFLGEERAGEPVSAGEATAAFLPIPGEEDLPVPEVPTAAPGEAARGVYAAEVAFDRPGFYEVEVAAALEGRVGRGTGAFEVVPEPLVPFPGDRAPRTRNHVLGEPGVADEAVDSRAATGGIPDPELHDSTIAGTIRAGRPALVVMATPVYCVSRFCGPVTDMVAELAAEYGDRADFIHVEIWADFQEGAVNEAAADWLLREGDLEEPWVFLIGADGRVVARWDNVATRSEIEPYLEDLPGG